VTGSFHTVVLIGKRADVRLGSIDRDVQNPTAAAAAQTSPVEPRKILVSARATEGATMLLQPGAERGAEPGAHRDTQSETRSLLRLSAAPATLTRKVTLYERFFKPVIDRILACVLLVVLSPILLVVGVMVAISLGRPIVLRQFRVGRNGERFVLHKFRTMHPDRRAPGREFHGDDRRITHKHPDDPRLTPVGQALRKWSLDELPQLWDVVLGTLSLVGPRPELESIVANYEPWQHARHVVKPGLTGLWQVKARGDGEMHEHTDLDIEYVQNVTLRGDLSIMVLTLPAILTRKGY
jgi:lipopolysaccharide/colanic/teichoic acid biosynthesis glycosyltransferase